MRKILVFILIIVLFVLPSLKDFVKLSEGLKIILGGVSVLMAAIVSVFAVRRDYFEVKSSEKRNEVLKRQINFFEALERPLITFAKMGNAWIPINVGKGPALDIEITIRRTENTKFDEKVFIPVLKANGNAVEDGEINNDSNQTKQDILKIGLGCETISALWKDVFDNVYFSYTRNAKAQFCKKINEVINTEHEKICLEILSQSERYKQYNINFPQVIRVLKISDGVKKKNEKVLRKMYGRNWKERIKK